MNKAFLRKSTRYLYVEKDYYVRRCTALLDAIGEAILKTENGVTKTASTVIVMNEIGIGTQ